jgi:TrmH family RNA methyltransferase
MSSPRSPRRGSRVIELDKETAEFQHLETLKRNRHKRHTHRQFFVEGVRNLNQALAHHWDFHALIHASGKRLSAWAEDLRRRARPRQELACAPALMAKLSDKDDPSELCAVVGMPEDSLDRIPAAADFKLVILDRPQNPGNLGTILRTCDAFGVHGLILTGHAVDLYDPAVIRASVGSFFALPAVRLPSAAEVLPWLQRWRSSGLRVVGTSARADQTMQPGTLAPPAALVFGNESDGLSRAWREACDAVIRIPITGTASSLNITSAVAIALYQQSAR